MIEVVPIEMRTRKNWQDVSTAYTTEVWARYLSKIWPQLPIKQVGLIKHKFA